MSLLAKILVRALDLAGVWTDASLLSWSDAGNEITIRDFGDRDLDGTRAVWMERVWPASGVTRTTLLGLSRHRFVANVAAHLLCRFGHGLDRLDRVGIRDGHVEVFYAWGPRTP